MKKNYLKKFFSLFLIFTIISLCSACNKYKEDIRIDNNVAVTYEFLDADADEYDSTQSSQNKTFIYKIRVVNNSKYKLENVEKTVFSLENQNAPYTRCLSEGYVEINPNDFSVSVPIENTFEYDIDEDEAFEILKMKNADIISFEINGAKFECTGNWIKCNT